jgi:thiol-disulfide isomerase/thioredoxin
MIVAARRRTIVVLAVVALLSAGVAGIAQEPILAVDVVPANVSIRVGGEAFAAIAAENTSIREADDIEVAWLEPDGFSLAEEPESVEVLAPFESTSIPIRIAAGRTASVGPVDARIEVVYTYCIGDVCFQIVEEVGLTLQVEAKEDEPTTPAAIVESEPPSQARPLPWPWIGFGFAVLLVGGLLAWARGKRGTRLAAAGVLILVIGSLAYGVARNQHRQAQGIGSVLCTSCVGIEESRDAGDVRLSAGGREALRGLDEGVELVVFYAPWCHSCPYAEAMVALAGEVSDRITYRFVDVEEEPAFAEAAGAIRSSRTVVPAILRVDSGEILFGIDDLEARLLELVGVGP